MLPQHLYDMELWEFNLCVMAYNEEATVKSDRITAASWQTANFAASAFAGKLSGLKRYLHDTPADTKVQPTLTEEQKARIDAKAKLVLERRAANVDS